MIAGLNYAEIGELIGLMIVVGATAGFFAGLFGVGGGAIVVPFLYECFGLAGVPVGVRIPLCVGTSLAIIIPTAIRSYLAHRPTGTIDNAILRSWAIPIIVGVVAGTLIARFAPEALFKIVFVIVAWAAAIRLLFGRDSWRLGDDIPKGIMMQLYGVTMGVLSTLMGIGGGLFCNLVMTLYGRSIHQSIATSTGLAVLIAIPGALGYIYAGWPVAARFPDVTALQFPFALGYISLIGAALITPTSLLTAPLGVKLAHALTKRQLEVGFGIYLFLTGARFFVALV